MRYFQKLLCLLILVLAASFGVGGCVLLYSDFSVQRSRMATANAAAHAQACTLLQTEILDLQRRGISTGDAALTARVTAQNVPAALWRGDTLVCATLEGLQSFPLGDAATVTVRTENSIYAVYASDLQGGLRLVHQAIAPHHIAAARRHQLEVVRIAQIVYHACSSTRPYGHRSCRTI